jgi:small neutral amino acid transporter SnatA (MarC family)
MISPILLQRLNVISFAGRRMETRIRCDVLRVILQYGINIFLFFFFFGRKICKFYAIGQRATLIRNETGY